jgi:hypothetical protein
MAKKSPTELRPLILAPSALAVKSIISVIIWVNSSIFYVSKRQTILSVGSLFDSTVIERNFSLANTVLTIVKLNEISQPPYMFRICFAICPRKHIPSLPTSGSVSERAWEEDYSMEKQFCVILLLKCLNKFK